MNMKIYFPLVAMIFLWQINFAQSFEWIKQIGGVSADDGRSIAVDADGSVYVTGEFEDTVDFDAGPGTFNLVASGDDVFIIKLDFSGNLVWAVSFGGEYNENINSMVVDTIGNVYTIGEFIDTVDFDPGPGVFNLNSAGLASDVFMTKFDASGNFIWAKRVGGTSYDRGSDLFVDAFGNVYATGDFEDNADFDPGPGTLNLFSAGGTDVFVMKLNALGNLVWAKRLSGNIDDESYSIALDKSGNVYTTGYFRETADFDPAPGINTYNLTSAGDRDVFISKLDNSGSFISALQIGGSLYDSGSEIHFDEFGNMLVTGFFSGTVDLDPSSGVFSLTASTGNVSGFIVKLDSLSDFEWAFEGSGFSSSKALDESGNIYTVGDFYFTSDFDPSAGVFNLSSEGNNDAYITMLDSSGNLLWAGKFGGVSLDNGESIAVDSEYVYITGYFMDTGDYDLGPGIYNLISQGSHDVFILKIPQCLPAYSFSTAACSTYISPSGNDIWTTTGFYAQIPLLILKVVSALSQSILRFMGFGQVMRMIMELLRTMIF